MTLLEKIFDVIDELIQQENGYAEHHPVGGKRRQEACIRIQAFVDVRNELLAKIQLERRDAQTKKP